MSPIILKRYTWSEDPQKVHLVVPFPGVRIQNVDIFITDKYIKINCAPYLWELFLKQNVNHFSSHGKVGNGIVEFILIKQEPKAWLEIEESIPDDKQYRIERRKAEVVKIQNFNTEIKERNAARRQELNSNAILQQMKMEKEERERIQSKIAADKMKVLESCTMRLEYPKEYEGAVTAIEDHAIRNSGTILATFTPKVTGVPARSPAVPDALEIVEKQC